MPARWKIFVIQFVEGDDNVELRREEDYNLDSDMTLWHLQGMIWDYPGKLDRTQLRQYGMHFQNKAGEEYDKLANINTLGLQKGPNGRGRRVYVTSD